MSSLSHQLELNQQPLVNVFETVIGNLKQLAVNARDLHSWLDSKQDFSKWIKRRITKYGFVEGRDYLTAQVVE